MLVLALLLGGGTRQGLWGDSLVQLASLPLLGFTTLRVVRARLGAMAWCAIGILAASAFLMVAQLAPLSPWLWTTLPGREMVASVYGATDIPFPSLPLSLDREATVSAALSLLPAVAVFLGALLVGFRARRKLSFFIVAFALISVFIGLAQIQVGHQNTISIQSGPGFAASALFANRNHFAALLYIAMSFAAAWSVGLIVDRRRAGTLRAVLFVWAYAVLLLGVGMARSRAGLALGGLAGAMSLLLALISSRRYVQKSAKPLLYAGTALGIVLILNFALLGIVEQLETDIAQDYRFEIAERTVQALQVFLPYGSGFGTFVPIYQLFEPVSALRTVYVNHAHNDWLEIVLEGGVPAAIIASLGLFWVLVAGGRLWRPGLRHASALDLSIQRAASVGILLLMLHSIVDYPLRTTTLMVTFALCCALILDPAELRASHPRRIKQSQRNFASGADGGSRSLDEEAGKGVQSWSDR